jgi:hypothetical protein
VNACRTRRTRGEIGLCFLLAAADFLFDGAVFDLAVAEEVAAFLVLFLLAAFLFALAAAAGVVGADVSDWATANCKQPSAVRRKVPTRNGTAKRRTQILLTA